MASLLDLLLTLSSFLLLLLILIPPTKAGRYVSLNTTSDHAHYFVNDLGVNVKAGTLIFNVTSTQDAIVRLAHKQTLTGQHCDIIVGSISNTAISVRESCSGCNSLWVASGTFLSTTTPSTFWLDWSVGATLTAGEGSVLGESTLFTHSWQDQFEVNYVTATSYHGQEGQWNFLIDTPPYFTSPKPDGSTVITVPESSPINTTVITLSASDHEADAVTLDVIGQHSNMFAAEGSDVLLKEKLDFETDQWFLVTLSATDGRHNTTATFTLRVSDVNDESPVMTSGPLTSLQEERTIGDVVAGLFVATDRDQGDTLTYSLEGNHSSYFAINETSGEVSVARRLNREGGLSVLDDLRVVVTDAAKHSAELQLVLNIVDVNDNRPQFESDVYSVNVTTSLAPDIPFLTLNVTDADEGDNANVSLSLLATPPGAEGGFWVAGVSLYLNVSGLEPQQAWNGQSPYTLTVGASDSASEGTSLAAFAVVHVWVQADDNYPDPVWVSPVPDVSGWLPELSVNEDVVPGTALLTLSARDDDASHLGDVTYSLMSVLAESGLNASHVFSLGSSSGDLRTASVLDRDVATGGEGFYVLTLQALTDIGPSRQSPSSEVKLKVTLNDVNDNAPSLSERVYRVNPLSCGTLVGTRILSLTAADNDVTPSALTYSFVSGGGTEEHFALDSVTGDVTLKSNVTVAADASYSHVLTVSARDGGTPEMTSSAAIVVPISSECGSGGSETTDEQDLRLTNTILILTCTALGTGVLAMAIKLCTAKANQKGSLTPVTDKKSVAPLREDAWAERQHTARSVHRQSTDTSSSSSGSQPDSNADTQLTDCSSIESLSFV